MNKPAFATVVLDVDSTISGIEGIDWLAKRRGEEIADKVATLTDDAMHGKIPLERVYGARLAAIRPRREDLDALARAYVDAIAPNCVESLASLRRAGVHIVLISGGLRHALFRLALHIGVDLTDLHAVEIRFDAIGAYAGYDDASPLTTSYGKRTLLERIDVSRPLLAMGDGATDLVMREVADKFVAFTGFVTRENVVSKADAVIDSFPQLTQMVLS
ncbi:MAG TPA: HAD-IB family phosphatase [Gemmatimonadaceae bacterium]|jgi:phosphoserine phosphatase